MERQAAGTVGVIISFASGHSQRETVARPRMHPLVFYVLPHLFHPELFERLREVMAFAMQGEV